MLYSVTFRASAARELRKLPISVRKQVSELIDSLTHDPRPHGVKKMTGVDAWRIRIGDYRVVYSVMDQQLVVEIIKIGNRREVYR
ncbi:MAG TPA: type II toxin-antitoxin system RelE/ParE family toxin [Candidatus Saccharimonadia bacterium]|nr:type II toxin-antitoxin system RelE/ParE family toxin [Candidatus Saccharimonadia bacterium]